jgi:hypothetical protein
VPDGSGLQRLGAIVCSGNQTRTIDPGIYPTISASGNCRLTLRPGLYVLAGGGMKVSGNSTLTGTDVTLYNTSANFPAAGGATGNLSFTGNGSLALTPPTSGTYAKVLVFQDRANTKVLTVSGNGMVNGLAGTIYGAVMPIQLSGNGAMPVQLIADSMTITGNGEITIQGATLSGAGPETLPGPIEALRLLFDGLRRAVFG